MLRMLRTDLMRAENDREKQLKLATASLDHTNETSLLNQLVRASRSAHEQMLKAVNPTLPDSPLASIRNGLATLLSEHIKSERERQEATDKRQRAFEADVKAAIERLETRKTHDSRSARGGGEFENAVTELSDDLRKGAKALERLLREAKDVLQTLTGELEGFGGEEPLRAAPMELSEPESGET